ncbi:iron-sulfur cluster biosynthesis family protein [Bacillus sp. 2205SS5-2]|uniref:iron-sulfur cluster biosynthesis family protein n=1 Tax=Bacillus sp. 2205SS5-2 TaxID=3109031 RepID=UPI003004787E
MEITITKLAQEKLTEKIANQDGFLKLKYETEGCGCVVSGVPTLWLVEEIDQDEDVVIEMNTMPILVEKSKMIFLDETLKIDFSKTANTFVLKSPGQILNGRMSFINKLFA